MISYQEYRDYRTMNYFPMRILVTNSGCEDPIKFLLSKTAKFEGLTFHS